MNDRHNFLFRSDLLLIFGRLTTMYGRLTVYYCKTYFLNVTVPLIFIVSTEPDNFFSSPVIASSRAVLPEPGAPTAITS